MLIYICDDQQEEVSAQQVCLEKAAAELSVNCTIKSYCSGETLINAVECGTTPSLVILDVYMEGINGIETGQRLRSLLPDLALAFLTNSRDFAVDAFDLNALHYIIKPMTLETAHTLLERLLPHLESSIKLLKLPIPGGPTQFPLAEISKIISKNRGVEIHFLDRRVAWLSCRFREVETRLAGNSDFLLVSRGCIVNLNHVQSIDYDTCYLKNGGQLPISRRERLNVQSRYGDFLFRRLDQMKGAGL